jgi:hypothetical protein
MLHKLIDRQRDRNMQQFRELKSQFTHKNLIMIVVKKNGM